MRLRQNLGLDAASRSAVIVTHSEGYGIQVKRESLDLLCFEDLITQSAQAGDAQDPVEESRILRRALALWRGPVLSNVDSESLHRDVIAGMTERRLQTLQRRIDLDLRLGNEDEVIPELQALTSEYPLRERFSAQLMLALYRSGRQADALDTYRQVRDLLDTELGVDPGEDLQELHQAVLTADPALAPSRTPRITLSRSQSPPAVLQVPPDIRGFVGRAEHVDEITKLITTTDPQQQTQVVTLSGQPGAGKTALAVHLAHRLKDEFPDGVLFLDLRGYSTDSELTAHQARSQLLRMLGLSPEAIPAAAEDQARQYQSLLAGKRLLLVLDNVAAPDGVRPLLPAESRSAVLITSRDELRGLAALHGARSVPVDPLSPEEPQYLPANILGVQKVQLSTVWLSATILTIYAAVFDSSGAYFIGLLLMGTVIAMTVIALAISGCRRLRSARAFTTPRSRKHLIAHSLTMLPLLVAGYPLAELTTDYLGLSVRWLVPAFATAFYATAGIFGLVPAGRRGRMLASPTALMVTGSLGAITAGLTIGALALFAERGPETSWSTGDSVDGAYAEGKIHQTAQGELQVSGELLDTEANYLGTRLHIHVQYANDSVKSWNSYNHGGKGTVEPIGGAEGLVVPGDIKSIHVTACAADADETRHVVVDTRCGAPIEIWKR
ncbi:hypothetical protein BJ970_007475 [Saccharopolyspora phatthalungensis]|uniref:DNA-binding SARP family transcriptional activator n=2 Tax=Saccharopolyspora phatthalungensis TaxID=664693 RepID=A0A840QKG2_9PSEU|nr:hypothetical protein [Saccharopolyspora phatthalungensis]